MIRGLPVYDSPDSNRSDLVVYTSIVRDLGARSVLDVGCGTRTFACLLAKEGIEVLGVDPAAAMLAVARQKEGAYLVHWVTASPPICRRCRSTSQR